MSPVDTTKCFAVRRGEITGRADVNFWRLTPVFRERFAKPNYPAVPLGNLVELVQYGCSALARPEPVGVPMLRMNNLQEHGWDLTDLKYIQMDDEDLERYRLTPGDLLFNRTNSKELVGKCEVFREKGDWVFASYLIRVRLQTATVLPQFASDFLATNSGRLQIDRLSRQIIGMTNINAEELRTILLPLPPLPRQREFVAAMDKAREARRAKLAKADDLLCGMETFVLDALGLAAPPRDARKCFAIYYRELKRRFDPKTYLYKKHTVSEPYPIRSLASLTSQEPDYGSGSRAVPRVSDDEPKYIRITDFRDDGIPLGHEFMTAEVVDNECQLEDGDMLFARSGATAGKTFVYTHDIGPAVFAGYCIRFRFDQKKVLPWFVYYFSKTSAYRDWVATIQRPSGQPNINKEEFKSLEIPVPPIRIQEDLVKHLHHERARVEQLRREAEAAWQEAKADFESELLERRKD